MNINLNKALSSYSSIDRNYSFNKTISQTTPIEPIEPSLIQSGIAKKSDNEFSSIRSNFLDSFQSIASHKLSSIKEAERISKLAMTNPESVDIDMVVHHVAKAEDSIKEITSVISAAIASYQRIMNMQI